MLFVNKGEPVKVRIPEVKGYKWITLKKGFIVELPEEVGIRYGFEIAKPEEPKTTKGSVHKKKEVETKQFEVKLTKINGLGLKTAQDLTKIYPNEKSLRNSIKKGDKIPIRDDLEKKLRRKFR